MKTLLLASLYFSALTSLRADDCIGLSCVVYDTVECATRLENNCEANWTECAADSNCDGLKTTENLEGFSDAHRDADPGESGFSRICFTGESTVCVRQKACSKCGVRFGSPVPLALYCKYPAGASWDNIVTTSNFTLHDPCTGMGGPR
jgi:hypothetical protein